MKYLLTLLLLLNTSMLFAQYDKIYLKDGMVIKGHVESVKWRYVLVTNDEWRRPKRVTMADVHHIRYADGTSDTFTHQPIVYKGEAVPLTTKNVILGAPISGVALNGRGYIGMGLYYERMMGRNKNLSLTMPLNICFPDVDFNARYAGVLATPGLLFHTNVDKRADFAFGPSLLLTNANGYDAKKFTTGALLNLRLNVRRTSTVFCVHSNFGVSYPSNQESRLFFQLGIAVGGTF